MPRRFRTQAEEAAYALGLRDAAGEADAEPLTMEQVKQMSPQEAAERMPEIQELQRSLGQEGSSDAE